jgi:phosphoglycolate phosphatase-like HAD superfamily hydrolase
MRLVLWDIDGTLVHTAGHGRAAFAEAFERLVGRPPAHDGVPMAGRTDHAIALELLELGAVPQAEERLPEMFEELHAALLRRRRLMASEGHPQPGVREALLTIGEDPGFLQSLMTGNIEPNAKLKLAAFDLDRLVELEIGGYGSGRGARSDLVDVARRKAKARHGVDVPVAEIVVVGDTPLDVEAARAAGARAVAVATGPYRADELERARPDAVLPDLRDTGALVEALSASSDLRAVD